MFLINPYRFTAAAGGTFTLVANSKSNPATQTSGGSTSTAVNTTGAKLIVVSVIFFAGSGLPVFTDSNANTWTQLTNFTTITDSAGCTLYYCINPTVGAGHTFSVTGSFTFSSVLMEAFSSTAPTFDQQSGTHLAVSPTTIQPGSITSTTSGVLFITSFNGFTNDNTSTINQGFTVTDTIGYLASTNFGSGMAYLIQSAPAAQNPTWTLNGVTGDTTAVMATFKP